MTVAVSISRLARLVGASPRALRYYEDVGLLRPLRTGNRARVYPPDQCAMAKEIVRLRSLDISVEDIRDVLDPGRSAQARADLLTQVLARRGAELEAKSRAVRQAMQAVLEASPG